MKKKIILNVIATNLQKNQIFTTQYKTFPLTKDFNGYFMYTTKIEYFVSLYCMWMMFSLLVNQDHLLIGLNLI